MREDGTYATETIIQTFREIEEDNEFSYLCKALSTNSVFIVNFYRNILGAFSRLDLGSEKIKKIS